MAHDQLVICITWKNDLIFDPNAEMSKFVNDSNILLIVDFGCIEVLNGSKTQTCNISHIWQWIVVLVGFIGVVLVPLHQFMEIKVILMIFH